MRSSKASTSALWGTLLLAAAFEVVTALATQDRAVRHRSPWQDDPYNTAVSLALLVVPVLALLLAVRLFSRALAGRPPQAAPHEQMTRAALAVTVVVDLVLCSEWIAVFAGARRTEWNADTAALVAVLAMGTLAAATLTTVHISAGALRRSEEWDTDWLDDFAAIAARLPGGDRRDLSGAIAWTRRRALLVFALGSSVGAVVVVGGLAVGEHWTDPWLITWALVVESTLNLVVCLLANAIAGFVNRPPDRLSNVEVSFAGGVLAVQIAVAFHAQLWTAITGHPANDTWALTQLTVGAALIGAAAAYLLSTTYVRRRQTGAAG